MTDYFSQIRKNIEKIYKNILKNSAYELKWFTATTVVGKTNYSKEVKT